jgi:hypothetical protein
MNQPIAYSPNRINSVLIVITQYSNFLKVDWGLRPYKKIINHKEMNKIYQYKLTWWWMGSSRAINNFEPW